MINMRAKTLKKILILKKKLENFKPSTQKNVERNLIQIIIIANKETFVHFEKQITLFCPSQTNILRKSISRPLYLSSAPFQVLATGMMFHFGNLILKRSL